MAEGNPQRRARGRPPRLRPGKTSQVFTEEERGAMKERTQELKAAERRGTLWTQAAGLLQSFGTTPDRRDRADAYPARCGVARARKPGARL
jgi:hypothetical protein